ncbi:hypothetical protein FRC08_005452 [Ceratobasidium sp. 394]|nr:hypothetical protein FRC08_005452 [Ceratobasidium sp. 394]
MSGVSVASATVHIRVSYHLVSVVLDGNPRKKFTVDNPEGIPDGIDKVVESCQAYIYKQLAGAPGLVERFGMFQADDTSSQIKIGPHAVGYDTSVSVALNDLVTHIEQGEGTWSELEE